MSPTVGPVFDESLASAALSLHLVEIALLALVTSWLLFRWLERRGRASWSVVPAGVMSTSREPYRSVDVVSGFLAGAPALVRAASFGCLLFGHLFVPLIVFAVVRYPFDGIAIMLLPGVALAILNWTCAWMLLGRKPLAPSAARSGAVGSLMANVGLVIFAGLHFAFVELQRRGTVEHACSSSVTFLVIVFAVGSVIQALLMKAALRAHDRDLSWSAEPPRVRVAEAEAFRVDLPRDEGEDVEEEDRLPRREPAQPLTLH